MASSSLVPPPSATAVKLPPAAATASSPRRLHHQRLSFALVPPSAKPLIKPDEKVNKGQVLWIIEAMKLINDKVNKGQVLWIIEAMKLINETEGSRPSRNRFSIAKAQNEVGGLSRDGATTELKTKEAPPSGKDVASSMSEEAISEFMAQVRSLVKLVDSRDVVELQLKQFDCEVVIRKKEALPQPPMAAPIMMMPPAAPHMAMPPPLAAAPSPSPATSPPAAAPPSTPAKAKSSHPPLKSPMAGTFYRSPGPGLGPFVKPGDKVNKGQVLCIIEAMKLMNEIEADQAGTVVEILVEDGKPVGIEQPLFIIEP